MTIEEDEKKPKKNKKLAKKEVNFLTWIDKYEKRVNLLLNSITTATSIVLLFLAVKK